MPTTIRIPGTDLGYTVGKVLCVGRNYAAHAAEMKSEVPTTPMLFLKPGTAIVRSGGSIVIPRTTSDVHHEVELVALVGKGGKDIAESDWAQHVVGFGVGLDMTARDIQSAAKGRGHPWTVSKGFDSFAPLGDIVPASSVPDPHELDIELRVNGVVTQSGNTRNMIFGLGSLLSYCSSVMTLEPGDLIFTGTPEGVGPVVAGDRLTARISGLPELSVDVTA